MREGTCDLLVALCGRPTEELDTLPGMLARLPLAPERVLRDRVAWDHPPRCEETPVTPVLGLEVASPVAVCTLRLRLVDCATEDVVGSTAYSPPSSDAISVIRDDSVLAASPVSDCATWALGNVSPAGEFGMVLGVSRGAILAGLSSFSSR